MKKILCVYDQNDFDGKCSGAIVRKKYPDCDLMGWRYYQPFDAMAVAEKYDVVIVVDLCLGFDDMVYLQDNTDLYWIDHHEKSKEKMGQVPIKGMYSDTEAACELCWRFFFPNEEMPRAVHLLGRWDMWDHDEEVELFQYGMRFAENGPDWMVWDDLLSLRPQQLGETLIDKICRKGGYAQQIAKDNGIWAMKNAIKLEIEGMSVVAVNNQISGSKQFDSIDGDSYDMQMVYRKGPDGWSFSCYSVKEGIDVGTFCAQFNGGGGRKGCGGFKLDEIPWKELR